MVREHLPLVYKLARQVANATALGTLEYGDLVNVGVVGLYKALDKFDESRGFPFGVFAARHVKGSMLDEVARVRQVPRGLRDKQSKLKAAFDVLGQHLMREPSDEELASQVGITIDEYHEWLVALGWTTAWSLEDLEAVGTITMADEDDFVNPMAVTDMKELRGELIIAIRRLSDREQRVLDLYYTEELTLKEIAYVLDLSESQVSRIHSKSVLKLRQMLETEA